ncbi:hypothetical protein ABZP36_030509 [Zizania latifolia]
MEAMRKATDNNNIATGERRRRTVAVRCGRGKLGWQLIGRFLEDTRGIGPLGLSPNKIGEGITKETAKDWKGLRVTIKLTVQNRQAKVSVVPSTVVLVIKALKDLPRGLPPMSDEEWLLEFEKYKLSTEYKSVLIAEDTSMSLQCVDKDARLAPPNGGFLTKIVLAGAKVGYLSWLWTSFHFHEKNVKTSVLCSSWIIGALWEYYTSMYIVNTQRPYFLDIDFGSVFTWLQCDAPYTNCAKVDSFFRSSIPGIFAIGDVAAFPLKMYDIVCMPNIHFKSLYRCRCQSKVWAIADSKRQGYLGFGEFVAAMQSGMEKGGSETSLACSMWQAHVPSEIPKIEPDSDLLKRVEIKTREQIERMRETCGVAREVLDAAARVIKPGITTDEIDRVVPEETIARGTRQRKNSEWRWQRSGEFGTRIWLAC